MSRRKIGVTPAEMMQLRNEPYCLSNKEIAKRLDISYPTVLKYIGKQNGTEPEIFKKQTEQAPTPDSPSKPEPSAKVWDTAQSLTRLAHGDRSWLIDTYRQQVELERPIRILEAADIRSLINELTYLDQLLERARKEGKTKQ